MKYLSMEQWNNEYVKGDIERFDQKYTAFNRAGWDPEFHGKEKCWSFVEEFSDKPGYRLEDWALSEASVCLQKVELFNSSKPNPKKVEELFMHAMGSINFDDLEMMPPILFEGAKIQDTDPLSLTSKIKKAALWFGADMVGICKLDRRWVYSHTYAGNPYMGKGDDPLESDISIPQEIPEAFQYAIVMAYEENYDCTSYNTSPIAEVGADMGYSRMNITNEHLSSFISNIGFQVINCSTNDVALSIPLAMLAGLGQPGRNGQLITPKYGPRVRISKVLTDLPLTPDQPIDFGVTEFCNDCKICAEKCPSQSLSYGERTIEPNNVSNIKGVFKWHNNAETCRRYWAREKPACIACVSVCPYNKPDTAFHRMVRWFTDHLRWGDPFYVLMDKVCGYGKLKSAENFWEEWDPKRKFKPWE